MRILIHHVDSYIGEVLLKELRKTDAKYNRIFATRKDETKEKPNIVKRILSSAGDSLAMKRYAATILTCSLVVFPLDDLDVTELLFVLKCLQLSETGEILGEIEKPITFILVSSVFTWANTPPKEEGGFVDDDYQTRESHPDYQRWKDIEDLVLRLNQEGSKVRAHVVCAGIPYGFGEDKLASWFKNSWLGEPVTVPKGETFDGSNKVPWVHVSDIGRLCRHLAFSDFAGGQHPYMLCVDTSKATLEAQIRAIAEELTEPYSIEREPLEEDWCALNLDMESSAVMMVEDFSLGEGWVCKDGLPSAARLICEEYTEKRNIQPVKVAFLGPPKSGKSTLASLTAQHFNVVVCTENNGSNTCRYRGFVLDGVTMEQAQTLENTVDFVVLLQTAKKDCVAWGSTEEEYDEWGSKSRPDLEQFFIDQLSENSDPQDILYLPYRGNQEQSTECIRIFIEGMMRRDKTRGRPRNFGIQTEEEVTEALRAKMETKFNDAQVDVGLEKTVEKWEPNATLVDRMKIYLKERQALTGIPTRAYLLDNVTPTITEGLIHITQVMPDDPIDSLANFLEKCAAN
eukprot:GEMP01026448.1.p1 GENE.GEMP01026448.1~~GEMP01026448.1.p1  ORF type:complete len:570 (+),score=136.29 GEMP01026448.1:64-1773(+)